MAFSLNKIMLIGNLGKDCETRFTTNNISVTSYTMATTFGYKGKDGNWVNETTWHNLVSFNLSDYMKENLKKGKKFYIEGRVHKRDYTDKEGIKRYVTEVITDKLIPLDSTAGEAPMNGRGEEHLESEPPVDTDENADLPF
jgi:single-strand DNA-binding protein